MAIMNRVNVCRALKLSIAQVLDTQVHNDDAFKGYGLRVIRVKEAMLLLSGVDR